MRPIQILIVAIAFAAGGNSLAQERPVLNLQRVEGEPPVIDGLLTDAEWERARIIDEFWQVEPVEGAIPSERTRVRVTYDDRNLYFAIEAFDSDSDAITATVMTRDAELVDDDYVHIVLDPYDSGRDGFGFLVNPLGTRRDGLTSANRSYNDRWDAIWRAKSNITPEGWVSEVAIPFQSLSFDPGADAWGLLINRGIARKNEHIRWASIDQDRPQVDFTLSGRLRGIEGVRRGRGLEAVGYARTSIFDDALSGTSIEFEPSADIFYRITPSLTGTLTLNTDFSDAPLDERQVNTSRFSLFFPETRDFFLQDAALFEFGGRPMLSPNGRPFFSRNIGFATGAPVNLDVGIKLSGELGPINIGALSALTGSRGTLDAQQLSVARLSSDTLPGLRIGGIVTDGNPSGTSVNNVVGADIQIEQDSLFGAGRYTFDAYYARSSDSLVGDDDSFGFELSYPNGRWRGALRFKEIGENYRPALGFVNRPAIRNYSGFVFRQWRPDLDWMRVFRVGADADFTTDLDGDLETRNFVNFYLLRMETGGFLTWQIFNNTERLKDPFTLPRGIFVDRGNYEWTGFQVQGRTSRQREFSIGFTFRCCDWYNGSRKRFGSAFTWRPSRYLALQAEHNLFDIDLPTGSVDINVTSIEADINISPDASFRSQIQYDNISKAIGYFGAMSWEFRPETEIFVGLTYDAVTDFDQFDELGKGVSLRIGNSFRF